LSHLVRWRADPTKVRVSIRRIRKSDEEALLYSSEEDETPWFECSIEERARRARNVPQLRFTAYGSDPILVMSALISRAEGHITGVDAGLGVAFIHPWKREPE